MANPMLSPEMSKEQALKIVKDFQGKLLKHRRDFTKDEVYTSLPGLIDAMYDTFCAHVEKFANMISRRVKVNRNHSPEEMLNSTGRKQYTDHDVVKRMPKGEGEEVDVIFFKLGRYVTNYELEKEYELRGLKPADPYSLGAVNEADPAFADSHLNGTQWKDALGKWCYIAFRRWRDGPFVRVVRHDDGWGDRWWFAGLRK
jgi:hypothetical protein